MSAQDDEWPAVADMARLVQSGKSTALSYVERALKTIKDKQEFNAVISLTAERAKKRAKMIDRQVKNGEQVGRLAGVPFIAKDNFLAFGSETTAGSNILKNFKAPYQSTAIERLEEEGAILVAKANLDAFAHGSSTENSDFMTTKNPHDKTRVPGGSSGGSAAAVVLNMVPFSLGTDTGGSIRLPAAFCGAVGYKPTYGLVSRSGVVAMASSTDVIGPLARTVDDVALVLDCMSGKDELDSTTIDRDKDSYATFDNNSLEKKTIGVIKEYLSEDLDPQIKARIEQAIAKIQEAGPKIKEVSLPSLPLALAAYYIIVPAEVSSNLSRYDGQRYGFSNPEATNLDESYSMSRSTGFGDEAKRRIMIGTYVLSSGYYDAYYKRAQRLRTKLINEYKQVFDTVDFLVGPTAPTTAFPIGALVDDPLQMYLTDIMTVAANLVGVPAISIPAGKVDSLPVGLQLVAPQQADRALLSFTKQIEEVVQ
ncbi:MAG: Asp-tRNA(Asn)/Glu-tRNA(Gln) amidotransferase subunit GatA [Candidatus Saccharibacteria bacterium]|nr:Asp-tRNA(Asn)/Glu-tRNA(Gln) amidotransferase subunit GatA [Candidatus Saccharibacteria bacterium]